MGNEGSLPVGVTSTPGATGYGSSHSGIPQDAVPYTGPLHEYRVLLVKSKLKASFGGSAVSDVNNYMTTLAQQYAEFFKLDTFFRIPHDEEIRGLTSVMLSYQAIFSRPAVYVPSPESWQLQVLPTRLTLGTSMRGTLLRYGVDQHMDTSMAEIYNILAQQANRGGRLICLECNGQKDGRGYSAETFGVNLFFNIPRHPNPKIYTNLAYCVPMQIIQHFGSSVDIQMDVNGTLAMHLNQGWKLVDIIIPQHETGLTERASSNRNNTHGSSHHQNHRRLPSQLNTIWFFEKEQIRCNDTTPLYQVTVIDVYVPVKAGFGSTQAQCDLAPLLTDMGRRGWKLVCILDTPKMQTSGWNVTVFLKAFFQRPLVSRGYAPGPGVAPAYGAAQPPPGFNTGPPAYAPGAFPAQPPGYAAPPQQPYGAAPPPQPYGAAPPPQPYGAAPPPQPYGAASMPQPYGAAPPPSAPSM